MSRVLNSGRDHFKRRIEKDHSGRVVFEEFAVGGLQKSSATEGKYRRTRQCGEREVKLMVFYRTESALSKSRKQLRNGAVDALNLFVQIDEPAAELFGQQLSKRAFAGAHKSNEDE